MRYSNIHLSRLLAVIALLALTFTHTPAEAQTPKPILKRVVVKGNADGKAKAEINYIQICNAKSHVALRRIETSNRQEVFGEDVFVLGNKRCCDVLASTLTNLYYEGMFELPSTSCFQEAKIMRGDKYITFSTQQYAYLGGANGIHYTHFSCYDLRSGERVDLDYLSHEMALKSIIYDKCQNKVSSPISFDEWPMPQIWHITDKGVRFHYNPGEVGPMAYGQIEGDISDASLRAAGVKIVWE